VPPSSARSGMRRPRSTLTVLTLAATGALVAACGVPTDSAGSSSGGTTGNGVKVGVAEMLTGSGAFYGNAVLEGIKVAQKEINDKGGILGKPVELQVEDNASDNAQSTSLIKKFAGDAAIGAAIPPTYQPNFNAACAAAGEVGLPVVSAQSGPPDAKNNTKGFCYTMTTDPIPQMTATFKYLAEKKGLKKLVMVYDQDNGYIAFQRPNLEKAAKDGGYTLEEIGTPGGTSDFGPQITSAIEKDPDAVFPAFVIEDGARFMQQARAKGLDAPFFDPMSQLTSRRLPELSGDAALDLIASTPQSADDIPSFETFLGSYQALNGKALDDPTYTGFGYDALMLIAKAMTDANSTTDRTAIKAKLDGYKKECFSICFTSSGSGPFFAGDFYFVKLTADGWAADT
jgi:branched-chain amino acid transport system substrate-binding protein